MAVQFPPALKAILAKSSPPRPPLLTIKLLKEPDEPNSRLPAIPHSDPVPVTITLLVFALELRPMTPLPVLVQVPALVKISVVNEPLVPMGRSPPKLSCTPLTLAVAPSGTSCARPTNAGERESRTPLVIQ